jgi:hypothetical protein
VSLDVSFSQGCVAVSKLDGTVTHKEQFQENEGPPAHLDVHGSHLAVATSRGVLWIYDISRPKPQPRKGRPGRSFEGDGNQRLGSILSVRLNCDASRVSVLARAARDPNNPGLLSVTGTVSAARDTKLYVYDVEADNFSEADCGADHFPVSHMWDDADPRLLAAEVQRVGEASSAETDLHAHVHLREVHPHPPSYCSPYRVSYGSLNPPPPSYCSPCRVSYGSLNHPPPSPPTV